MLKVLVSANEKHLASENRVELKVREAGFTLVDSCHDADVGVLVGSTLTTAISWLQGRGKPVIHCDPYNHNSVTKVSVDDIPSALGAVILSHPGSQLSLPNAASPEKAKATVKAAIERLAGVWGVPLRVPVPQEPAKQDDTWAAWAADVKKESGYAMPKAIGNGPYSSCETGRFWLGTYELKVPEQRFRVVAKGDGTSKLKVSFNLLEYDKPAIIHDVPADVLFEAAAFARFPIGHPGASVLKPEAAPVTQAASCETFMRQVESALVIGKVVEGSKVNATEMRGIEAALGRETLEASLSGALSNGLPAGGRFHTALGFAFKVSLSDGGVRIVVGPADEGPKPCGEFYGMADTCGGAALCAVKRHVETRNLAIAAAAEASAAALAAARDRAKTATVHAAVQGETPAAWSEQPRLPEAEEKNIATCLSSAVLSEMFDQAIDGGNISKGHFWSACGFAFHVTNKAGCPVIAVTADGETKYFGRLAVAASYATQAYRKKRAAEIAHENAKPFDYETVRKAIDLKDVYEAHGFKIDYCDKNDVYTVTPPEFVGKPISYLELFVACNEASDKHKSVVQTASTFAGEADGSDSLPYWRKVELNVRLPLEGVRNVLLGTHATPESKWSAYGYDIRVNSYVRNHEEQQCILVSNESKGMKSWEARTVEDAVLYVRKAVVEDMKAGKI